jgi:hypothetical protein
MTAVTVARHTPTTFRASQLTFALIVVLFHYCSYHSGFSGWHSSSFQCYRLRHTKILSSCSLSKIFISKIQMFILYLSLWIHRIFILFYFIYLFIFFFVLHLHLFCYIAPCILKCRLLEKEWRDTTTETDRPSNVKSKHPVLNGREGGSKFYLHSLTISLKL